MYLKSIEMHGFKSFANKIVLDFHNGITGIVGPNGSGKSNVSDAVRWVLGEQSAKQLRGASMQDVIFSGTENRKPLSYAYVAITMDNSDRALDVDYKEVTVARRVYRSGESEYLLNGSACRLKDVNELFYDTGIGKEGYSIIGQGQIEKILSGRPEEKRELFDEAAGIVKYKRRKATAQKKLESQRENMVRIHDILNELEHQVGPLERQSEKARLYLKKREELKTHDVGLFLAEMERMDAQLKEVSCNTEAAEAQLKETGAAYEEIKAEYEKMEAAIEAIGKQIDAAREELSNSAIVKGKLEGQVNVLHEQIKAAEMTDGHFSLRVGEMEADRQEKLRQKEAFWSERSSLDGQLSNASLRRDSSEKELRSLREGIAGLNAGIESRKSELIALLSQKAELEARQQKFGMMAEQANIQKAELTQRIVRRKSEESGLDAQLMEQQETLQGVMAALNERKAEEARIREELSEWERKLSENARAYEECSMAYHKAVSRLESLRNIAERYDGYGNSIRKVMGQKETEPGILGVVSDIIKVERQYETAIETALGGSIQNIVTEDEGTAKRMIAYLKKNRLGRATFLPLTSVDGRGGFRYPQALHEPGVIGLANELVENDEIYDGVTAQLLGRVVVVDTIDHAVLLARKFRYSLSIVTLEGESLRPGGSMTGGAFKQSGNLLGRNREIEDLTQKAQTLKDGREKRNARREEILTAQALLSEDLEQVREQMQQQYLLKNTAELDIKRTLQKKEEEEGEFKKLLEEGRALDQKIRELKAEQEGAMEELAAVGQREAEIAKEEAASQEALKEKGVLEEAASQSFLEAQMEEAGLQQKREFVLENLSRVEAEIEKCDAQMLALKEERDLAKEDVEQKKSDIEALKKSILASDGECARLEQELKCRVEKKEQMTSSHKDFFVRREEISSRMSDLDKELFRLNGQKEKLTEEGERQVNYIWEEYELTRHGALALGGESELSPAKLKQRIDELKDEIKGLGDVNVNAIEEYKEVSGRYEFLKAQHDDLVESETALLDIIEELDVGMRKQFTEKFAQIQEEFNKSFQELFGGGKGTLELLEDEDILECGIRIIAQPPGKKLQNMILLSGGEKSLTAISLLFAIQNLKPSPFCLLDEIEAALDDSNVGRFAGYLHKLSKNTQFIVITHRRGTMANADRLYGITMQEKGVSTLVSVDLIEHQLTK